MGIVNGNGKMGFYGKPAPATSSSKIRGVLPSKCISKLGKVILYGDYGKVNLKMKWKVFASKNSTTA